MSRSPTTWISPWIDERLQRVLTDIPVRQNSILMRSPNTWLCKRWGRKNAWWRSKSHNVWIMWQSLWVWNSLIRDSLRSPSWATMMWGYRESASKILLVGKRKLAATIPQGHLKERSNRSSLIFLENRRNNCAAIFFRRNGAYVFVLRNDRAHYLSRKWGPQIFRGFLQKISWRIYCFSLQVLGVWSSAISCQHRYFFDVISYPHIDCSQLEILGSLIKRVFHQRLWSHYARMVGS